MSLINKMLQDLEKRGQNNPDETFEGVNQAEKKAPRKSNNAFLIISVIFTLIYLGLFNWYTKDDKPKQAPAFNDSLVKKVDLPAPTLQSVPTVNEVTQNEAIVAEITAAIEAEIRSTTGDVDEAYIQKMVAEATKQKLSDTRLQDNEPPVLPEQMQQVTEDDAHVEKQAAPQTNIVREKVAVKKTPTPTPQSNSPVKVAQAKPKPDVKATIESKTAPTHVKPKTTKVASAKPKASYKHKAPPQKPVTKKVHFVKQVNPEQKSEHLYQQAISYVQKGRVTEAQDILAKALLAYPSNHDARQTLAALLLDNNRVKEAKEILSQGLAITPEHIAFRMAVARLEVELGNRPAALETLLKGVKNADNNAQYQAFAAILLQRENRHEEAVKHFQYALGIDRGMTNAFVGLGISLEALNRLEDAQVAYSNAKKNTTISPNLRSFVNVKIKEVNQRISSR